MLGNPLEIQQSHFLFPVSWVEKVRRLCGTPPGCRAVYKPVCLKVPGSAESVALFMPNRFAWVAQYWCAQQRTLKAWARKKAR
jgi:hypothetical protein